MVLVSNIALLGEWWGYVAALVPQIAFYAASVAGWKRKGGLMRIPSMFVMLHLAAMTGLARLAAGQAYATWDPRRN